MVNWGVVGVVGVVWNLEFGIALRTVGCVEPDGGDGRRGGKGYRTAEAGQAEDETQRAREPHCGTKANK